MTRRRGEDLATLRARVARKLESRVRATIGVTQTLSARAEQSIQQVRERAEREALEALAELLDDD